MSVGRPRHRAELRLRVLFEGDLRAALVAETYEDERRLVEWLVNSSVLYALSDYAVDLRQQLLVLLDEGRS